MEAAVDEAWWSCEEDTTTCGLDPEALLSRGFLPPPPRPPAFLDPPPSSDGLTTCDLCAWATQHTSTIDSISFMSWSLTLVIVSIISAVIGAAVMVSVRRCLKRINENPVASGAGYEGSTGSAAKRASVDGGQREGGLCCWISRRQPATRAAALHADHRTNANHYTLEETYSEERQKNIGGAEALYAELDKPVYQNTGYVLEPDTNSPPSSAYYSDLSSDRTYETVGNTWEMHRYRGHAPHHHHVSSDYV